MIQEHRIRFSLDDLTAVVLECASCGAGVSIPMCSFEPRTDGTMPSVLPKACPNCGALWNAHDKPSSDRTTEFLWALVRYREYLSDEPRARIQFDLPYEESQHG